MHCQGYTKVWDLAPGEVVRLDGARGTTLRVTRGALWLTQERDLRDIVLAPGDVFTIERGGVTVIEARGNTTVCVLARHVEEVRLRGRAPTLVRRAAAALRSALVDAAVRDRVPYV